jgi:superfamily I DNA/RNA helicase
MAMEYGQPIPADDWRRVLKYIKLSRESSSSSSSSGLLVRGTKKRFTEMSKRDIEAMGHVPQEQWSSLFGCTEYLLDIIRSKRWRNQESPLIPYADDFYRAYARWGPDAPTETKVRVGTIHSAKGAEADNVVVLLTTTPRCQREASLDIASQDAEHRVWYVAVTRARRRLFVCREARGEKGIVPEYKI